MNKPSPHGPITSPMHQCANVITYPLHIYITKLYHGGHLSICALAYSSHTKTSSLHMCWTYGKHLPMLAPQMNAYLALVVWQWMDLYEPLISPHFKLQYGVYGIMKTLNWWPCLLYSLQLLCDACTNTPTTPFLASHSSFASCSPMYRFSPSIPPLSLLHHLLLYI